MGRLAAERVSSGMLMFMSVYVWLSVYVCERQLEEVYEHSAYFAIFS